MTPLIFSTELFNPVLLIISSVIFNKSVLPLIILDRSNNHLFFIHLGQKHWPDSLSASSWLVKLSLSWWSVSNFLLLGQEWFEKYSQIKNYICLLTSFWCLYCHFWTYLAPCSRVSIVNFERANAGWVHAFCATCSYTSPSSTSLY